MGDSERPTEPWSSGSRSDEPDATFHALAHPYRRFVLEYLDGPGDEATVTELAATIASARSGADSAGDPTIGVDTIESALHHMHLPKLTEAGLVEFDPGTSTVTATDRVQAVESILEAATGL